MHRAAGATEVMISRPSAGPSCTSCARSRNGTCRDLLAKLSPVDLVLVEGFKRDAFPKLEIHRAANGKPLLHPDDPHIVAIASDTALPQAKVPVVDLNDIEAHRRPAAQARDAARRPRLPRCGARDGAAHRRLLRVLRAAAADRRHGAADRRARARRWPRPRRCRSPRRAGAWWRATSTAPVDLPPFDNSAVDGYAVRHARSRRRTAKRGSRSPAASPPAAPRSAPLGAGPGDPHLHRRADAGRRRHRVHAGGCARRGRRRDRAGRAQSRRQPPARRRGRAQGRGACCRPDGGWRRRTWRSPPRSG